MRELGTIMLLALPEVRAENISSPDLYSVMVAVGYRLSNAGRLTIDDLAQAMLCRSLFKSLPVWMTVRDIEPSEFDWIKPSCSASQ